MRRKRKRKYLLLSVLAAIFLFIGGYLVITKVHAPEIKKNEEVVSKEPPLPKPTVSTTASTTLPTGSYKTLTLKFHEKATFAGASIEPYAIIEDSRCAKGVQCIWAGRLRIGIGIFESDGIKNFVLQEGESTTTAHLSITFVGGSPYPEASRVISEKEYIITLNVKKN